MKIFLEPILSASGPMATRTAALKIASVLGAQAASMAMFLLTSAGMAAATSSPCCAR